MAKGQLTAQEVRRLSKIEGLHRVAPGLYLRVRGASALWTFRYTVRGKAFEPSLGPLSTMTLSDALAVASDLRAKVRRGDGIESPRARQFDSRSGNGTAVPADVRFCAVAEALHTRLKLGWKPGKHADDWLNSLKTYAYPLLGEMSVADIGAEDLLAVLSPIWSAKQETASRVRQRIEAVLSAARVRGLRTGENPAAWSGNLDQVLPSISKRRRVEHHAAMDWKDVPAFMAELRQRPSMSAWALQLTILTASRTGEVIGAQWGEFDPARGLWAIPAVRMKAHMEHRVPLSRQALALLEAMPRTSGSDAVFWGRGKAGTISQWAMLMLLRGMRPGLTVHGFRSSFRDWAAESTAFPAEVVEMALAHTIGNQVEAAYRRGDLLDKRRELMQAWADWLDGVKAVG